MENPAIYPAVEIEIWETETRDRLQPGIQPPREKLHRERQCVSVKCPTAFHIRDNRLRERFQCSPDAGFMTYSLLRIPVKNYQCESNTQTDLIVPTVKAETASEFFFNKDLPFSTTHWSVVVARIAHLCQMPLTIKILRSRLGKLLS